MALRSSEERPTAGRLRPYPLRIAPIEGESLPGFVLRLAQRNRLPNGNWLRDDIGQTYNQNEWTDENFRRLAMLSGRPEDELRRLHHPLRADGTAQFKTGILDKRMLERWAMRYCPVCLEQQGYHQSIWFLRVVTVCPRHGARLVERCPSCAAQISWYRPKFLHCTCKAPLPLGPVPDTEKVPEDELAGIRVIYDKCGVDHGGVPHLEQLPESIRHLELEDLISFLWLVGSTSNDFTTYKSHLGPLRATDPHAHGILQHAFGLAADWPRGFHLWLGRTRQTPTATGQVIGLGRQFPLLKSKLLKIRSPAVLALLQEAFLAFATDRGIYIQPDQSLFVAKGSASATGMISVSRAAEILGVSPSTASTIAYDQGWIDRSARQSLAPKAVPEAAVREFAKRYRSGIEIHEAAVRLMVDSSTMIELLEAGIVGRRRDPEELRRKGSYAWSITEADIVEFQRRISESIRPLDEGKRGRLTSLQAIARRQSVHGLGYAALVRAVLDGRLVPRAQEPARGPSGLLFDAKEAVRFCATSGSDPQLRMTTGQAADFLGVNRGYILTAVHLELLRVDGQDTVSGGYMFSVEEVERFGREFTTVGQLAKEYGRPLRATSAALKHAGITPFRLQSGALREWWLYSVKDLERKKFARFIREYKTYREQRAHRR